MIKFRFFLVKLLRSIIKWIEPETNDLFLARVRLLVKAYESAGVSGEYKRHQVYARLIKDFPDMEHKYIGLKIEEVINNVPQ